MTRSVDVAGLPGIGEGFVWCVDDEVIALRPQTTAAHAVFTTRVGGVCPPPCDTLNLSFTQRGVDLPAAEWQAMVSENRMICSRLIGADSVWTRSRAVHGIDVVEARSGPARAGQMTVEPPADGLWTMDPSRILAVSAADCAPILVTVPGRVATVHAGWRGALAGVVQVAVRQVTAPDVFVGPSIGPCCLVLSEEVTTAFVRQYGSTVEPKTRHVDLWRVIQRAAMQAGARSVSVAGLCTVCHPALLFSHRREGGRTGRQGLVARVAQASP